MNTAVTATGMQVQAKAESGIVISNEAVDTWTASSKTVNGKYEVLPTSTANLTTWYHSSSQDANNANAGQATTSYTTVTNNTPTYALISGGTAITSGTVLYTLSGGIYSPVVINDTKVPATGSYYQITLGAVNYYSQNKFYIKSATTSAINKALKVKSVTVEGSKDSASLNKALRVGLKFSTSNTILIYAPISGATLSYTAGGAAAVSAIDSSSSNTTPLNTDTGVTSIPATDNGLSVTIYVWFEGEDAACTSNNVTAVLDTITVSVQFTTDTTAATPTVAVVQSGEALNVSVTNAPTSPTTTTYQWSYSADNTSFNDLSAEQSSKITTVTYDGYYKCTVTYDGVSYTSPALQYSSASVNKDSTTPANLKVTTVGPATVTSYQWYVADNDTDEGTATGTNSATLESFDTSKYYYCILTTSVGTIQSDTYHQD